MNFENTSAFLPTKFGNFNIIVWRAEKGNEPLALVTQTITVNAPVLVRIHSECITGDTFTSLRCDCGKQKEKALKMIEDSENGVFIYLRQEGRGIGLFEKIKTYKLQEEGIDTHEANILLGHAPDQREYSIAKDILNHLNIKKIKLITNNPSKVSELTHLGFDIVEQVPLWVKDNKYNKKYISSKKTKFQHIDNKHKGNYYIGISGVTNSLQIRKLKQLLNNRDPLLKIHIGINSTNKLLQSETEQNNLRILWQEADKLSKKLIPVLHYSFKNSQDYKDEIKTLLKNLPFIETIQLNDIKKDYFDILYYASRHASIIFPINNASLYLLENPKFIRLVIQKKITILLDNSGGTGKQEEIDSYKKTIKTCLDSGINTISVAGGFGPNQLQTYFKLKNYFKINLSIDAESKLQTNNILDLEKVEIYIKELL